MIVLEVYMRKGFLFVLLLMGLLFCGIGCADEKKPVEESSVVTGEAEKEEDEFAEIGISKSRSENVVSLKAGKILENISRMGEDSPYYCNCENMKNREDYGMGYPVLVCKDPVYHITYYVNYGRDYFVYALREDVSELVLEIPARELYCKDGELYFVVDSYEVYNLDGIENGNVLKYNPTDGTVEFVFMEKAEDIIVYPDGICYEITDKVVTLENGSMMPYISRYYYSFAEKTVKKFESQLCKMNRWEKGQFELELTVDEETGLGQPSGVHLKDIVTGETRTLRNLKNFTQGYRIMGDDLYYIQSETTTLMRYHLKTGEETVVAELALSTGNSSDFIIQDDVVYFGNFLRVSLTDGKQYSAEMEGELVAQKHIDAFYTDGETLFCIMNGKIWKLTEKRIAESGFEKTYIAGRPVEYNCYEYQFSPIE